MDLVKHGSEACHSGPARNLGLTYRRAHPYRHNAETALRIPVRDFEPARQAEIPRRLGMTGCEGALIQTRVSILVVGLSECSAGGVSRWRVAGGEIHPSSFTISGGSFN
jgi:hypothetical protein